MMYTKRKNYRSRWIIRLLEVTLILGIIFFSLDAIHQMAESPQYSEVEVVVSQSQQLEAQTTNVEPETVLDAFDYHRLGLEHHMGGEYREAILDYSRAIAMDEDIAASWLNRGVAYEQMGNRFRAMYDFNRFLQRDSMTIITRAAINESIIANVGMSLNRVYDFPIDLRSGQIVNISVVSVEPEWVDTLLVLVDSEGRPIAANDDARRQDGSLISMNSYVNNYTVNHNGRYTLRVSHAGGGEDGIRPGTVEVRISISE
jgi:tetratricopeptide (TPR) repeat protein